MFIDEARIYVEAGAGGEGMIAFRREKFVPRGGPSGGDGGRGGHVALQADSNLTTLQDFRYRSRYRAGRGTHGGGSNRTGADAEDVVLRVPVGTVVRDSETGELLGDLDEAGQRLVVARGGRGGRGNAHFATATRQAPQEAESGVPGETRTLVLELKLLADVGLVGSPNAGKSTLLARVSAARPKIADYPFTTLAPNLGVVSIGEESFVMADVPGLLEGAHEGRGLGIRFLRHIERTRFLLILIDATIDDPVREYHALRHELASHSPALARLPHLVVPTKLDLLPDYAPPARGLFPEAGGVLPISSATGRGVDALLHATVEGLRGSRGAEAALARGVLP
ncbi:MAG: GTPase ObgE [Gemmatimonadetes bacterium]|nr:GTPase ObgE [Gemmatimonadota bacterium]